MGVISNSVRNVIARMRAIASTSSAKRTKTELKTNRYSSWIDDASFTGPGMEWRWSLEEWQDRRRIGLKREFSLFDYGAIRIECLSTKLSKLI